MTKGEYQITPLGAAIIKALPDREKARTIQRRFNRYGTCPASALFTAEQAAEWAKREWIRRKRPKNAQRKARP